MNCYSCHGELTPVRGCEDTEVQFENALIIRFGGGYGMFVDPVWERLDGVSMKVFICHECAHALCASVPWVKALLDPRNSHSHTMEYKLSHPVHYGPDY